MYPNDNASDRLEASAQPLSDEVEVAVVGAGPVGLTMAAMLAGYGARVAVLEKATGPAAHSRAAVVHARTLETLETLGIVDEMLDRGVVVPHFGIHDRDRLLLDVPFENLPTRHPYTLMLPQDDTEDLLRKALRRHGGEVLWGCEVAEIQQNADSVHLTIRSPRGDRRVRAKYVVGCDGASSSIRAAVDIPFEGETYPQSFVLADVRMEWKLRGNEVQLFFSPEGLVVVAPLPNGRHRIVATVDDASPEPSLVDIQALLDARGPRTPRPLIDEVVWSSRFRVHRKAAARFRKGSVFLCSDAAHVHSPAGGQGMNTGIQDAANLAWKLGLVLRGQANRSLLDSYERERMPVAREVVSTTHRLTRLATLRSPIVRRLRNAGLGLAGRLDRLPRRLAANLAELDLVYRDGWSIDGSTTVERFAPTGDGSLAQPDPAFVLVIPEGYETHAMMAASRFSALPVRLASRPGLEEAAMVRPDGYVAGRGSADDARLLLGFLARALEG